MITIDDKDFKVGVGVITIGKRKLPDYKTEKSGADFKVFIDKDRKGVAYARNMLIKQFYDSGYDYWFIFDDDVYPNEPDHVSYIKYFTETAYKFNYDCFLSPEYFRDSICGSTDNGEIILFSDAMSQFMFCSRKMVEVIGYIPTLPNNYGYEDALFLEMLKLAQRNGLINNGVNGIPCPTKALCFIHPTDMYSDNIESFTNMTYEEKQSAISANAPYFEKIKNKISEGKYFFSFDEVMNGE